MRKKKRIGVEAKALLVSALRAGIDAQEHVLRGAILVAQIVDVVGRDQRHVRALVQAPERFVGLVLDVDAVALQFKPEMFGTEEVTELSGHGFSARFVAAQKQLVDLAGEAA